MPKSSSKSKRGEIKTVDIAFQESAINNVGYIALLNGVQEGTSFYNRVGRKIEMKSIRLRATYDTNGGDGDGTSTTWRIMVIYDRQPNGAFPASTDLLLSYDNAGVTSQTTFSDLNMNNIDRFQILADIMGTAPDDATTALYNNVAAVIPSEREGVIDRYIKLNGAITQYKSTSNPAQIGDISTGALYLYILGDDDPATAPFALNWQARLRFWDS